MSNADEKIKTKKWSGGLKFMGMCFSSHESQQRALQQRHPHEYHQFQQHYHHLHQQHQQCEQFAHQYQHKDSHQHHYQTQNSPYNGSVGVSHASVKGPVASKQSPTGKQGDKAHLHGNRSPSNLHYTPKNVKELQQNPVYNNVDIFTFEEMKLGTKHFRPDLILGEGGFGVVYRGKLDDSVRSGYKTTEVAIKQLNPNGFQGDREWLAEVNYLGQLSHPNLVKLIGYCCEDEHRILVYEYMASGCLEKHLFRRMSSTLTWLRRLKIALDAAKGLAFLHGLERPIIYRDFKTSNILLGADFNAKLSDFGLAKDGPMGDQTHVSTRVMGTYGYAAPEYVMTGGVIDAEERSFAFVLTRMESFSAFNRNMCNLWHPPSIEICVTDAEERTGRTDDKRKAATLKHFLILKSVPWITMSTWFILYVEPEVQTKETFAVATKLAQSILVRRHLTARSDVYGFGVVLLEMLIGRRALDKSRPSREHNLVEWCRPLLNNNKKLLRILDTRIDGQYTIKAMMRVANLAYLCLSQNPKGRPLMSHVVEILETIYAQETSNKEAFTQNRGGGVTLYEVPRGAPNISPEQKSPTRSDSEQEAGAHPRRRDVRSRSEPQNPYGIFIPSPDIRPSNRSSTVRD